VLVSTQRAAPRNFDHSTAIHPANNIQVRTSESDQESAGQVLRMTQAVDLWRSATEALHIAGPFWC
jgi:hypothetical protein